MPYFHPIFVPAKRRRLNPSPLNDFTLPLVIWQYILQYVAADDLHVILECRTVCKTFRRLIDDWNVYSCINMAGICGLNDIQFPLSKVTQHVFFAQQCLEANNPEAIFRQEILTMKKSGNILMTIQYLKMVCREGTIYRGLNRWIGYHDVAYYVLCMLHLIQGNHQVKKNTVEEMLSRLNWRISGWDAEFCRNEAHRWLNSGSEPTHVDILKHIPPNYSFPPGKCTSCGEHEFHRPFLQNMWFVNGDRNQAECCDLCKYYVEAANFYYEMRYWATAHRNLMDWFGHEQAN